MCLRADGVRRLRIPYNNVSITAGCKRSLFRIHSKNPRWRRRNNFDKPVQRKLPFIHAMMMQQVQTILDSRSAVRNFREIAFPQYFLILKTKWAVIRRHNLQVVVFQSVPQLRQILFFAQRRRKYIFRAFKTGTLHLINRKQKILRTRLRKRRNAAAARLAHLIQRRLRR